MMNYVYILKCEDGTYYTGWTNDLEHRYRAHLTGHGAKYTRAHKPIALVYAECYDTKREAMAREYAVKQLTHHEKERLTEQMPVFHGIKDLEEILRRKNMEELKFYRCRKCGKIAVLLHGSACPTMCCGEEMEELTANTTDAAVEKHVPVVVREDGKITVSVGSVPHPMTEAHYIEFIALATDHGFRIVELKPGDEPKAELLEDEGVKAVYAYCNLHGLWKTES